MMKDISFAVCLNNEGYEASLELRKLYQLVPDGSAATHDLVRVIDESGEDYRYPAEYFVPVDLPESLAEILVAAA